MHFNICCYFDYFTAKYAERCGRFSQYSCWTHHSSMHEYKFPNERRDFSPQADAKKRAPFALNAPKCYISVIILDVSHLSTYRRLRSSNSMHVVCFNHSMMFSVSYKISLFRSAVLALRDKKSHYIKFKLRCSECFFFV